MSKRTILRLAAVAVAVPLASGCWVLDRTIDNALGRAADSAGNRVGEHVGNEMGNAAVARMNPMMTQMYLGLVFAMAFNGGGYAMNEQPYKPGQWTRWNVPDSDDKTSTLERAYLFDDKDGNPWWKVKWTMKSDDGKDETLIVEALFDKSKDTLLRMRQKLPNETEGKEVPVSEQTYYAPPTKLTKQSLEGGLKGTESVTVPAGTFSTKHYQFSDSGGGTIDYYLSTRVPGGAVKQTHVPAGEASKGGYTMVLAAYGDGSKSELGITP